MEKIKTEPSNLTAALVRQFKPDSESVRKAYKLVENNRATFAVNALKFGLCALAAKTVVPRGKFGAWLSSALASNGNSRPSAERTAREYMGFARVFSEKLSNLDKLAGALETGVEEYCAIMSISREQFNFATVMASAKETDDLLNATVRGMTLTQMRQLLREGAERAYADEQAEQSKLQPKTGLPGLQGGGERQNPQMILWEDWTNELEDIDKLVRHKDKLRLSNDQYKMIAQKLRATADEIESLINA